MKQVQIIINGEIADYLEDQDLSVKITKQNFDLENQVNVKGNFAQNINLPNTARNAKILGWLGDPQNSLTLKDNQLLKCVIISQGYTLIQGNLEWLGFDYNTNIHEFQLISDNINWSDTLGELNLNELTTFRKIRYSGVRGSNVLPFPNNVPNTLTWFEVIQLNQDTVDLNFPLIAYGNFKSADPSLADVSYNQGNVTYNPGFYLDNSQITPLDWTRLYPSVYIKAIVIACFKQAGYAVAGKFLTDPTFDKLLMAYTNEDDNPPTYNTGIMGRIDVLHQFTALYFVLFTPPVGGDGTFNAHLPAGPFSRFYWKPILDNNYLASPVMNVIDNERYGYTSYYGPTLGDYVPATFNIVQNYSQDNYGYVVQETGEYYVSFEMIDYLVTTPLGGAVTSLMLVNRKRLSFQGLVQDTAPTTGSAGDYSDEVLNYAWIDAASTTSSSNLFAEFQGILNKGDIIEPILCFETNGIVISIAPTTSYHFIVRPLFNEELDPAKNLPSQNCRDFLRDFINTFNLFLDVEPLNKIVYINKFEDYFYSNDYSYNLDEKSSISIAKVSTKKDYKRTYYNTSTDPDDALISDNETDSPAVDRTDTVDYYEKDVVFNTNYQDITEIEGFYSDTKSALFSFIQNGNFVTGFILPTLANEDALTYTLQELNEGSEVNTLNYQTRILNHHGLFRVRPADPNYTVTTGSQLWIEDVGFYYDAIGNVFAFTQVPLTQSDFIIPVALYYSNNGYYGITPSSEYSLNYSNEYLNNQKYLGIFDRYFKNFVISLSNTLLVEVEAYLNTADINEMNPRRLIAFNNQTYYLNTIKEYDPLIEQTTTVSLIKKPN